MVDWVKESLYVSELETDREIHIEPTNNENLSFVSTRHTWLGDDTGVN